jgi:hypothetical protein
MTLFVIQHVIRSVTFGCLLIILNGVTQIALSQQGNNWYFGKRAGITFNTNPPSALPASQMDTNEGCAVISDNNGRLLFYTDGATVWNRNHRIMLNGSGLKGHASSSNSATIVPQPGSNTIYYIFTAGELGTNNDGYYYSELDMSLDGGMGGITNSKNILLYHSASEKLTAVRHSNGIDAWVITRMFGNLEWRVFKVDCNGVNATPVVSFSNDPNALLAGSTTGCLKASPDGTKIVAGHAGNDIWEILQFNAATGALTNNMLFPSAIPYGVEFSPDSKLVYIAEFASGIDQYNISTYNATAIAASQTFIGIMQGFLGALQLGPDNKIYCNGWQESFLGVINNPNVQGAGCGFNNHQVDLTAGTNCILGLPVYLAPTTNRHKADITYTFHPDCATVDFNGSTSATGNAIWHWDFGDGTTGMGQQVSHVYAPGLYTTQLLVQAANGCDATASKDIQLQLPVAFAGNDTIVSTGQPVQLHATGGLRYEWSPRDFLNTDTVFNPVATLDKDQLYRVKVTNAEGCSDEDDVLIKVVKGPDVYVPNAFSPAGRKKLLRPLLVGIQELQYFSVYNRWGQRVFNTREAGNGWDGRINGILQPEGVFAWVLQAKDYAGRIITKKGTVLLVR